MTTQIKVAVITADPHAVSGRLWLAAKERVSELLLLGPAIDSTQALTSGIITLQTVGPREKYAFRHMRGITPVLRAFRPDVVHLNNELWAVDSQWLSLLYSRRLIIHGAENQFLSSSRVWRTRLALSRRVIRRLGGYASWNQPGADFVVAHSSRELPTLVLPAIVPPVDFSPSTWSGSGEGVRFHVLLIGRLVKQKGFHKMLEALAGAEGRKAYVVHVCGEGPERAALQHQADQAGLDVVFHGHLSATDVARLMTSVDCLVQPSLTTEVVVEQFGRTVAEAMTVGLPCLTSDSGELPRVVGAPDFTFPENSTAELADRLESWRRDRGALIRASKEQAATARSRWAPERAADRLVEFWEKVAHAAAATR